MSLFYNPQKSGRGVSKEEATKSELKPFFKFFEIFGRKFWQLMGLNMLYIVMCIPIVTIGAATCAMTHVMRKFVLEQPIFVYSEFFGAFRRNFKRSVIVGLGSLIFFFAFVFNLLFFYTGNIADTPAEPQNYLMMGMNLLAGVVFLTINLYVYPQITYLDLPMKAIFRNAAIFCIAGFKRNMVTVGVYIATITLLIFFYPYSMIALPLIPFAQLAFLSVFRAHPIIQKHVINPYFEAKGEKNPEIIDYTADYTDDVVEEPVLFRDLGGKETPINKKKVKATGKILK
jgi:uncharacterized membrane protein YesL